eukprot:gene28356-34234_t
MVLISTVISFLLAVVVVSAHLRGSQLQSNISANSTIHRRLVNHNNLRRVIRIVPGEDLYVLEKELQLKL